MDSERKIFAFEMKCDRKFVLTGWFWKIINEELLHYKIATKFHNRK